MSPIFSVAVIVEGHGELSAMPVLLRRMVATIDPARSVRIAPPIRIPRSLAVKPGELERRVELAARRVKADAGAVVVLLDADDDCAATLGPDLLERMRSQRRDVPSAMVLAVREFEAWFLAAATSLAGKRGLTPDLAPPPEPDEVRDAKGWLQDRRTDGLAYSPTVDQPALAGAFDMAQARHASPSFDKLWRDVERLLSETAALSAGDA